MTIIYPEKSLPTLAIVGRTNVGKSTLFNRLMGERRALVSPVAATTRTSNTGVFFWRGEKYRLIDTGGVDFDNQNLLEKEIKKQIATAFKEAQLIVFLIDLKSELLPQEKMWAKELRKLKIPIILIGNKADNDKIRQNAHNPEWLKLGLGAPRPLSAANGSGVGDFLDLVVQQLKTKKHKKNFSEKEEKSIKVSLLGRPNVGKSTLFNSLIGEERVIVSPLAHTTRESHDTLIIKDGQTYLFVDTAGVRRQGKIERGIEESGVKQTLNSLDKSDLSILILDAGEPFTAQDKHLIKIITEKRKGLIVAINKWDLVKEKNEKTQEIIKKQLLDIFPPLAFAPLILVSAKTRTNVHKLFPLIGEVAKNCERFIEEKELRLFMKNLIRQHLPTRGRGVRHPYISSLRQTAIKPPTFEVTIKQKTSLHDSYLRFIENNLRKYFNFSGAPAVVYVRKVKV